MESAAIIVSVDKLYSLNARKTNYSGISMAKTSPLPNSYPPAEEQIKLRPCLKA
ncbi:hypothetical protein DAPPUDRAFT_246923 [Daphnia pulex]|uniref:Uncharacterized protein n=1 Tax=Daphnia pulex TaxID=6669 RepID=E9GRG3_DAPPU|nr:hypothetical protein DAPPUDRAFT_246923 [Daphnia pulex]|eukprot:EFX77919.1 hypothetical protein DAPPUDRAFT_246923 [Daphnia pulex]